MDVCAFGQMPQTQLPVHYCPHYEGSNHNHRLSGSCMYVLLLASAYIFCDSEKRRETDLKHGASQSNDVLREPEVRQQVVQESRHHICYANAHHEGCMRAIFNVCDWVDGWLVVTSRSIS